MDNRFKFRAWLRAWLKNHKKIAKILTLKAGGYIETDIATIWSEQWIPPDDYILMQCTGLLANSSYRGESEEDRYTYLGGSTTQSSSIGWWCRTVPTLMWSKP